MKYGRVHPDQRLHGEVYLYQWIRTHCGLKLLIGSRKKELAAEVKEMWVTDVEDTQIGGMKGPQGYRCHIQCRDDSRRDIPMHDLPLDRLVDSPDAIHDRPKVKIITNDTKFPGYTGPTRGSHRKNGREVGSSCF